MHRASKSLSKYVRPKCKVQGVMCHWFSLTFFICDSTEPHDSNLVVECLARCLERVKQIADSRGIPMPKEIVLWDWQPNLRAGLTQRLRACLLSLLLAPSWRQADNCSRENKNNTLMMYMAWAVHQFNLRLAGVCFMRMGHTHDLLGGAHPTILMLLGGAKAGDSCSHHGSWSLSLLPPRFAASHRSDLRAAVKSYVLRRRHQRP